MLAQTHMESGSSFLSAATNVEGWFIWFSSFIIRLYIQLQASFIQFTDDALLLGQTTDSTDMDGSICYAAAEEYPGTFMISHIIIPY